MASGTNAVYNFGQCCKTGCLTFSGRSRDIDNPNIFRFSVARDRSYRVSVTVGWDSRTNLTIFP